MKFEEVLPALREGKKITSEHLRKCGYQYIYYRDKTMFNNKGDYCWNLTYYDFVESDNWEIVKEKKKVKVRDLTMEQFKKYCSSFTELCCKCPFTNVICSNFNGNCWIKHKDLYSDKFLDQEIEIEEE